MQAYVYESPRTLDERTFADYLNPATTAVVSIDMHRGHLDDSADCPCPAPRARDLVEPLDSFHEQVRRLGVRLIHIRSILRPGGEDDVNGIPAAWRRTFPLHVGPIPNARAHALEGSRWTEWCTHVAPGDMQVSTKRRLSAFYPRSLSDLSSSEADDSVR